jgi:large subunit ribosomal protein L21
LLLSTHEERLFEHTQFLLTSDIRATKLPYCIQANSVWRTEKDYPWHQVQGGKFIMETVQSVRAIIETGGKQYEVTLGSILRVEKLEIPEGEIFETDKVLLIRTPEQTLIGTPYVTGAKVVAKVLKHGRGEKIIVFKFKPKKRYMRKKGHRQWFTELQIEQIVVPQ